ncbi:hypothetical protein GQ600_3458 [Phytophthora cactorum]|nr:hypothetical protein GQ600_3458 [Phytophthora cactorum]
MGKAPEWSDEDTVQLCLSWLEASEDPVTGTGRKGTLFSRVYQHWLDHKSSDTEGRSVIADTAGGINFSRSDKFKAIFTRLKSRERSGWNEAKYIENAALIYAERHKQQSEFMPALMPLRNKPKWTDRLTTPAGTMRKADEGLSRIGRLGERLQAWWEEWR